MSTMTKTHYDLCINGAGPVGATLACRLAAEGVRVLLIDRAALPGMEDPSLDGRAYAIAEGSRQMLEAAGIWDNLPGVSQPIREIRVSDGRPHEAPSPLFLHFGVDDAPEGMNFGWMAEARDLRLAINRTLEQYETLDVRAPDTGTFTFHPDHVSIRLASGSTVTAKLAVAAEGRRSPLRDQARIGLTKLPYHQCGIVATIAHEKPHDGVALEQFLPEGPFARLPMPGTAEHPHRSAIVWAEGEGRAQRFHDLPDEIFAREIRARMGDEDLGAITPIGRRWIYPLSAQYAQTYIAPRLALVGDAAHGIHPIAGQGLNIGFRDVIALADLLIEAHTKRTDPGSRDLLVRYQRRARPGNMAMLAATDILERLFGNDNPVLRRVRDLGIAGVHRLPRLRRAFVRKAMGV
ncbi:MULTISPECIES: UbiH/UbiF/VisC/COQ6 family ubiquinone biosynthesis hydroxylase [unclassified Gluconobacter]|uniref:UbiH/UbiF/VisC/COQ6 family ubiquinone biosynthesis hydroxylase n=1 Tax=unclassified Gluconobacter TaxID=2644261 RepID=UPI001C0457B6|nr:MULTISPECIES: UbiH/UbiF/VisC/COQ6 family ubiquinone biosynthesis hydroxylase [unclassified Gluconobacter]